MTILPQVYKISDKKKRYGAYLRTSAPFLPILINDESNQEKTVLEIISPQQERHP